MFFLPLNQNEYELHNYDVVLKNRLLILYETQNRFLKEPLEMLQESKIFTLIINIISVPFY
jgi:hypothetical protein